MKHCSVVLVGLWYKIDVNIVQFSYNLEIRAYKVHISVKFYRENRYAYSV